MKRFVGVCLLLGLVVPARAQDACASRNGDANADGIVDVSDGITVLAHLFLGSPGQLPEPCPRASGLPDTTQVLCFDSEGNTIDCSSAAWPGQDGSYRTGCSPEGRFVVNGDGTVTDTCTGLQWQQRTADLDGNGEITSSIPGDPGPDTATWQEALRYCEDLVLAERSDWRLPNARELETIVDYTRRHPEAALDPVFDGEVGKYWTSTSVLGTGSNVAVVVSFIACNENDAQTKTTLFYVRAVRTGCAARSGDVNADGALDLSDGITILGHLFLGDPASLAPLCPTPGLPDTGQALCYDGDGNAIDCESEGWPGQDGFYGTGCPMEERFRDNGDGTVTDACTGLMWQQRTADITGDGGSTAEDGATWQDALRYCDGLTLAGHDDWRLPSTRELESIVDYGRRDPCIDPAFETVARPHWTSSSLVPAGDLGDQPHTAGFVDFWYGGHLYHSPKMMPTRLVRAVRTAF